MSQINDSTVRWFVYFHYRTMRWRTMRYEPHPDSPYCQNQPYCPNSPYWLCRSEAQQQAVRLNALENRR